MVADSVNKNRDIFKKHKLHRGYLACEDKFSKRPHTNDKFLETYDVAFNKAINHVEGYDSVTAVLDGSVVMIDIDDMEQAEVLLRIVRDYNLNCVVIKTDKGMHFLWKLDSDSVLTKEFTKVITPIGLTVDIKSGYTRACECVYLHDKPREVVYDCEEMDTCPKWLFPIVKGRGSPKKIDKAIENALTLWKFTEGGRNDLLYRYLIDLVNLDFDKTECRFICEIINNYIFEEALDVNELTTITRDEAFDEITKDNSNNKRRAPRDLAFEFLSKYQIISLESHTYYYNNGVYETNEDVLFTMVSDMFPDLKNGDIHNVIEFIDKYAVKKEIDTDYIAFENCLYNVKNGHECEFSPNIVCTNKIPHRYEPDAYSVDVDESLDSWCCDNEEVRKLLCEMIGYIFYPTNKFRKCFYLVGDKRNGKSTFISMIQAMLGKHNYSTATPNQATERFGITCVYNKMAVIPDDVSKSALKNPDMFRSMVSGGMIYGEEKGGRGFDYTCRSKWIMAINVLNTFSDETGSTMDRIILVPFSAYFNEDNADTDLLEKLTTENSMSYLINIALDGLKDLLERNKFSLPSVCKTMWSEYNKDVNPLVGWLEETSIDYIDDIPCSDVYENYCAWCIREGFKYPVSKIRFGRELKSKINAVSYPKKVDGTVVRVYHIDSPDDIKPWDAMGNFIKEVQEREEEE